MDIDDGQCNELMKEKLCVELRRRYEDCVGPKKHPDKQKDETTQYHNCRK